ncbi:pilus assembly protein [Croceibacterium sp. LX-88]|uniref:Pilus assembly protein n=1 Tax=Croceibacterium selenioxidans TaxID=2838833 RepID=A0ABS5W1M4_9SPHN|nr:pilus assembly protein [Croceibacterium selenioxidans]
MEFAIVAPIFLMLLMAIFDLGFLVYAKAVLQGAVEEGARTASLENTEWDKIKQRVNDQVESVIPVGDASTDITFTFNPNYYANYNDIELPEDFTDTNKNKKWDTDECYVDRNNNQTYDTDVGLAGRGGAQDVLSISAQVTYVRIFPLWALLGEKQEHTIEASTYLRNQPFSAQAARVGVQICPPK